MSVLEVDELGAYQFAAAGSGVCGYDEHRIEYRIRCGFLDVIENRFDLVS